MNKKEKEYIKYIIDTIMEVSNGNYETQVDLSGDKNELDAIAISVNMMIDDIKDGISELQKERDYSQNILKSINDAFFVLNTDGTIICINKSASKLLGYEEEELVNKQFNSLSLSNNILPQININNINNNKLLKRHEIYLITKERKPIIVDISFSIIKDKKCNPSGILCFAQDITKRINYEEEIIKKNKDLEISKIKAEESNKLKSEFLANVNHEIRTPLNGIIGFSEIIKNQELSKEKITKYTKLIFNNSIALLGILNDIIDISSLESGTSNVNLSNLPLHCFIEEVEVFYKRYKSICKKDNIEIYNTSKNICRDITIYTDQDKLRKVFSNLMNNSLKFTDKGKISFGCKIKTDVIEFFVKDTGIGIPQNMHEQIFERFRQVDEGNTRKYGGTGLGLSISKSILDILGGEIWLESEPNIGTTFYFNIPNKKPVSTPYSRMLDKNKSGSKCIKHKTILIVEDQELDYYITSTSLKKLEVNIIRCENGEEAISLIKNTDNIDLILMDINMPVLNGFFATEEIRKFNKDIPIIAQSAFVKPHEIEKCYIIGFDDYIEKPIDSDILKKLVLKYI